MIGSLCEQLEALRHAETTFPVAIKAPASELRGWEWLNANPSAARLAWRDRSSDAMWAGLGTAAEIALRAGGDPAECLADCRRQLKGNEELRWFGGLSFDGSDSWGRFGAGRFAIPRLMLADGVLTLAVMSSQDVQRAQEDLLGFTFDHLPDDRQIPSLVTREYSPTVNGWQSRVDEALALIHREVIEKIVLARRTKLEFAKPLNPITLSQRLDAATHDCFVFCFSFTDETAFLGATPEQLFWRSGNTLHSEVVAGTRMRGENPQADEKLAIELLTSDKDQREHDIVRKSIRQKLHQYIEHLDVDDQASILRLTHKQHLRSGVRGELKPDVHDGALLKKLHPTPAVGGYPTENALPEIARIEPFNRGWYAAPVGWVSANSAQFAVAIRSGLVQSNSLSLYSGAGIVRGSDPEQEWLEVDNKIQDFMSILNC